MALIDRLFRFRESPGEPQPLLAHLEDLRTMVIKMALALGAAMIVGFCLRGPLFALVQHPLTAVDPAQFEKPQSLGVADSFSISLQLAFYAGIVLAFPFLLYFFARFALPALGGNARRRLWPPAALGMGLFLGGVAFAYWVVLPQALAFFYQDAASLGWDPTWTVRDYYSFATQLVIAFGLSFELPVLVLLLVKLGVLKVPMLRRIRPQAFVAVMIFAAVLTPTTDLITLLMMGGPMYLLYEGCIVIAAISERRKSRDGALPTARSNPPER